MRVLTAKSRQLKLHCFFEVDALLDLRASDQLYIVDNEPVTRVARIAVDRDLPRDIDTWDDYDDVCAQFGFATGQHDRGT